MAVVSWGAREATATLAAPITGPHLAITTEDGKMRLFSLQKGTVAKEIQAHTTPVHTVAWGSDGKLLATAGSDHIAKVWCPVTCQLIWSLESHEGVVWSVSFAPRAMQLVSASADGTVIVWNLENGKPIATLRRNEAEARCAIFGVSPNQVFSGSSDGAVVVWDVAKGTALQTLQRHEGGITGIVLLSGGTQLASSGSDGCVIVWDVRRGQALKDVRTEESVGINALAIAGTKLVMGLDDGKVQIWDAITELSRTMPCHRESVLGVAFGAGGVEFATGSVDGTCLVVHSTSHKVIHCLNTQAPISSVAYTHAVAASPIGLIKLYTEPAENCVRCGLLAKDLAQLETARDEALEFAQVERERLEEELRLTKDQLRDETRRADLLAADAQRLRALLHEQLVAMKETVKHECDLGET